MYQHALELIKIGNDSKNITTSFIIAQIFGRDHKNVLRDIRNLECSKEFHHSNFELSFIIKELPNNGSKNSPYYEITKDGFSFLVMGYTSSKAAEWKEMFIGEFNRREFLLESDDYILARANDILINKTKQLEAINDRQQHQLTAQNEVIAG